MIELHQISGLMLEAAPGAQSRWDEHIEYWNGEKAGDYNDIGEFAHYVVDGYEKGETAEFDAIFQVIERLIIEGNDETQGVAIVGFLEDVQNISSHREFGESVFVPYLRPKSREAWNALTTFWEGKSSLEDAIRAEALSGESLKSPNGNATNPPLPQ
ncbi:hypothetical protein EON80_06045 [bacterium]|nr:MAG: hypothetical protein EON80_06045 [bacterium]